MFSLFLKGTLLGLTIACLVGPLMITIIQASLEKGFRAGFAVAMGMWLSDALYIGLIIFALDVFAAVTGQPGFRFWAGVTGGLVLCFFGATSFFSRKNELSDIGNPASAEHLLDILDGPEKTAAPPNWTTWGLSGYWLKGFLINTINPGTVFFWLGVATAVVVPNRWNGGQTAVFFGSMLFTLAVTDALKAWAAKNLNHFLTPGHILKVRRGIGLVLLGIGVFLVANSFFG